MQVFYKIHMHMQPIIMDIVFHCKAPRATGQALNKCTIIIMILSLLSFEFCLFFTDSSTDGLILHRCHLSNF